LENSPQSTTKHHLNPLEVNIKLNIGNRDISLQGIGSEPTRPLRKKSLPRGCLRGCLRGNCSKNDQRCRKKLTKPVATWYTGPTLWGKGHKNRSWLLKKREKAGKKDLTELVSG